MALGRRKQQQPGWSSGSAGAAHEQTPRERLRTAIREAVVGSSAEFRATIGAHRQALSARFLTTGELILDFLCTPFGRCLVAILAITGAWALL